MRTVTATTWVLLCCAALLGADEAPVVFGKKPYVVRSIECEVKVPNGWRAAQDETGMIARVAKARGAAFRITRQPMLSMPDSFGDDWRDQLVKAQKKDAKVKPLRIGKYKGWQASWSTEAAGGARSWSIARTHRASRWSTTSRSASPRTTRSRRTC